MANQELSRVEENGAVAEAAGVTVQPPIDILERDDRWVVLADVPGVKSDDVDIRYENGELSLHARRTVAGRAASNYQRTFVLGENVAADKVTAELKDGVLTLDLPKVDAVRPRKIAVKAG